MNLAISSRSFSKRAIETFRERVPQNTFGFLCIGSLIEVIGAEIEKVYRHNTMPESPNARPFIEEMFSDDSKMGTFLDMLVQEFSQMEYEVFNGCQFHVLIRGVVRDILAKVE